jgi:hypothetical protein
MSQANRNSNRMLELLGLGFVLLTGAAFFYSARVEDFLGTTIVLFAAMLPAALWINSRSGGIPIFPTAAILYWIYFGLPTFRGVGERDGYSPQHVLDADFAVALFLFVGTAVWFRFLRPQRSAKPRAAATSQAIDSRAVLTLVAIGLGLGAAFFLLTYSGYSGAFGSATGILRAVLTAPLLLACYFLGYGRAKGMFSTLQWIVALVALTFILVLQVGGLQLIVCVTEVGAGLLGYIYTARRVPWVTVLLFAALVSVFQAGKSVVRDRYANVDITGSMTPQLVSNWFTIGLNAMQTNGGSGDHSVAERASLLDQLIRVMAWTPDRVPYLNGETYTYLPSMIVPRVLNPDRAPTQVVMSLLDVRYGFLTREATLRTAVGVNIVPEAFANFGYIGVAIIAVIFGIFTGYLAQISIGREATSLPTLLAIAAMVTVIDMEADLSYLFTTFFQSAIAIAVFYYGLRFVFGNQAAGRMQEIS